MIRFWEENKRKIWGFGTIVVLIISLIFGRGNTSVSFLDDTLGIIVTPFQDLISGVETWFGVTLDATRDKESLLEENQALKEEVARLMAENQRLLPFQDENQRLSELLKISEKYSTYTQIGATVIAKNPGIWYDIFTIDRGQKDSVGTNMALAAPNGIVGKIIESGEIYSKAQSILDTRSSVPAMSSRTKDLGVVKGDYTLMAEGLCKMEYIDADAQIVLGDEIVTSHLSEIYPEGLPIGKVIEIAMDTNGLTKYAVIEPYVDFKNISSVLVIDKSGQRLKEISYIEEWR